ncbi:LysE family translocator [Siculibacillus lacustris]|uniref:LysE family translocator n=1 Tax=Siculibacillus lacustris TaxID=1549641 RepID=UPI0013F16DA8|nr:LysE family transporter [Siculibacillus lacustris]
MGGIWFLLIGLGVGVAFSAPVGPVNIMCIQRSFRSGFVGGLAAGLGAVAADGFFAAVAGFGITAVSSFFELHSGWLQGIGGALLILFGLRTARARPHIEIGEDEPRSPLSIAVTTFGMTVTNPATVLGFLAFFGSLGDLVPARGDWLAAGLFVLGVVCGGSLWWLAVSTLVAALRDRMTDVMLRRINVGAGALLALFGAGMLVRTLLG